MCQWAGPEDLLLSILWGHWERFPCGACSTCGAQFG